MIIRHSFLNVLVAAIGLTLPAVAIAQPSADELLDRLAQPDLRNWEVVEEQLAQAWSVSGSPTADYLLRRGRQAMADQDFDAAYDHLTALTDHAPDFAEGWNARATMFFEMGLFGPAISDIQHVLAIEPRHFGALTGLGFMLEDMQRYEDALAAFRAAHAIHPHHPEIEEAVERIERRLGGQTL